jgi:hypothetical protein
MTASRRNAGGGCLKDMGMGTDDAGDATERGDRHDGVATECGCLRDMGTGTDDGR